jgi:hypothetical protein
MLSTEELLERARTKVTNGIPNKSQQKEVLDTINSAFYNVHNDLMRRILDERNAYEEDSKEYKEMEDLYYKVPYEAYRWNDKVFALLAKYDEANKLEDIAKFWREVKAMEIIKVVKTAEQLREEKFNNQVKQTSTITDKENYIKMVNEMIKLLDNEVTESFNKIAESRIKISKMPMEQLKEKLEDKHFALMFNTYISGKTAEEIKKEVEKDKQFFLLDNEIKILNKVKFDITSVTYEGNLKWKLNGDKLLEIETISAGGYNIQIFHYRTLVKLKGVK